MRDFIAKRFQGVPVSTLAPAHAAYDDLINLSIGDTDFTTDARIIEAAMADALAGHTKYTNSQGDPELIDAVRRYYQEQYQMALSAQEIFVTASSCFGMELAMMTILDPDDEVLLLAPYFWPYKDQIELAHGKAVEVPTYEEEGFAINRDRLVAAITPKTKAIILNNPCNPTGAAYDMESYRLISEIAEQYDLMVVADEIYTDYMYKLPFVPLRSMPGMAQRVITLNSFSKNYIMTGWRIGYIIATPAIVAAMKRINDSMVYSAPSVSQRAAIHALRLRGEIGDTYTGAYRRRVAYAAARINAIDKLSVREPEGTFYLFMNIKRTGLTSVAFCDKLMKQAHIAMIPGSAFGAAGEGFVRIACTVDEKILGEAFDRIEKLSF